MSEVLSIYRGIIPRGGCGVYLTERVRDHVVGEVARKYRLTPEAILGRRRCRTVSWPRQEVMWRLRELGYSFPEIGRVMGRDHTTAMHAFRRHIERNDQQAMHCPVSNGDNSLTPLNQKGKIAA